MTAGRLVPLLLAALVGAVVGAGVVLLVDGGDDGDAGETAARALPDCRGAPVERPESVVLTCADAGITVERVRWTGWGEPVAAATGVAEVNDCRPNCAAGTTRPYRVLLVAGGDQECPDGTLAYRRVRFAFEGASPLPRAQDTVADFPCRQDA